MPHPPDLRLVERDRAEVSGDTTDDDLMLLVRADHQASFEILVRRYQAFVLALATRYVGDASLGRDIAQDVFLSLWAERERYELRGRFRSYLVSAVTSANTVCWPRLATQGPRPPWTTRRCGRWWRPKIVERSGGS
jgi:hypothetical protein